MQIGVNRWTMPASWSIRECLEAAAQAGFDCFEVAMAEEGELTPDSKESEASAILESARNAGIEIVSLASGMGWKYPITSSNPAVLDKGMEVIRASLRIARWLGVDTVLCVPGVVNAETQYDAAYDGARGALRELAPEAEAAGVGIGVENVWNKFLLSPMEMARFLDEIDSPCVGAYFDVGNVLVHGFPQHWIRILGPRIRKVHVKDFKLNIGNITAFCNPLQGDVPWPEVREALSEIGYEGPILAEVDGYKTKPQLGMKHIAESLRSVFGSEPSD